MIDSDCVCVFGLNDPSLSLPSQSRTSESSPCGDYLHLVMSPTLTALDPMNIIDNTQHFVVGGRPTKPTTLLRDNANEAERTHPPKSPSLIERSLRLPICHANTPFPSREPSSFRCGGRHHCKNSSAEHLTVFFTTHLTFSRRTPRLNSCQNSLSIENNGLSGAILSSSAVSFHMIQRMDAYATFVSLIVLIPM